MNPRADREESLRIEKAVYGGDGLAHTPAGEVRLVPFSLPGELVELPSAPDERRNLSSFEGLTILQASPDRVPPRCVHFGACGGCQYQMAAYPAQLAIKKAILQETLARAGIVGLPPVQSWASPEPYGYRNRIRMRVRRVEGKLRFGYSARGTQDFLPISMCPIAAPLLWRAAQAMLDSERSSRASARMLDAASEVEFFCDGDETRMQATLLCHGKPQLDASSFTKAMEALKGLCAELGMELSGAAVVRVDPHAGRILEILASWGATGLSYPVGGEAYWVSRGGFFQVNRLLLPRLLQLVCDGRSGGLAWDLFAGVGLFSRVLAKRFEAVTAVEASPAASGDLARALAKLGPQYRAVQSTTLEFLRRAVLDRERPDLIVLDPPRAGAGEEACSLLARLVPAEIVYLSCDPATFARDVRVLAGAGYRVTELHLIDLFPQTYHLETLGVLRRDVAD